MSLSVLTPCGMVLSSMLDVKFRITHVVGSVLGVDIILGCLTKSNA